MGLYDEVTCHIIPEGYEGPMPYKGISKNLERVGDHYVIHEDGSLSVHHTIVTGRKINVIPAEEWGFGSTEPIEVEEEIDMETKLLHFSGAIIFYGLAGYGAEDEDYVAIFIGGKCVAITKYHAPQKDKAKAGLRCQRPRKGVQ